MKVLFATSEAHPLAKTGGLADVSGALPAALQAIGVEMQVLMPGYPSALEKTENLKEVFSAELPLHGETALLAGNFPASGVPVYLIRHPRYFGRSGLYQDASGQDWPDNALRFGLLSQLAAQLAGGHSPLDFRPDVLHCNDWQSGLAPAYLHYSATQHPPSLFTVHNLAYQGVFPPAVLSQLQLPPECFSINGLEYFGSLSFLKAGLYYADRISTVSPNYASEIQSEASGMGLHGLLAARRGDLSGILNGIDTKEWNPAADPHLAAPYSRSKLAGKAQDKQALQQALGLVAEPEAPLLAMVSRLTHQKGSDVVIEAVPRLVESGAQLVVLGTGENAMEAAWRQLALAYPGRVSVRIGYDEGLAHRIEAGADLFLMPSRFEPCGLNQLYSQRYGTPPLVTRVGGLADTVIHATPETLALGTATGFVMTHLDADELVATVHYALTLYRKKSVWKKLVGNGMRRDFGWEHSAHQYLELYRDMSKVS